MKYVVTIGNEYISTRTLTAVELDETLNISTRTLTAVELDETLNMLADRFVGVYPRVEIVDFGA